MDRLLHASIGGLTAGISPVSLLQAWQDWAIHLAISPGKQSEVAFKAAEKWSRLVLHGLDCASRKNPRPCISPLPQDRRFADPAWQQPPFSLMQQAFLLTQQWWHNATVGVPGVSRKHEVLVEFYSRQLLDIFSPSNFLATNPVVLQRVAERQGVNLVEGLGNLAADIAALMGGGASPDSRFRPGREVAITPGDVVFRNEMIELIRYRPITGRLRPEPILIVPAWIMKYYILDLSPHNSLVRYLVEAGFEVFCISWRNPTRAEGGWSFDDYRSMGLMAALDAVSGPAHRKIHVAGYCLGGTLAAIAAATMARDGDGRLASLSLLASLVDFHEPGEIGLFIDESQVSIIEDMMWGLGYLDQRQMAGAFQMLRSRDLLWSRIVRDYLMGERTLTTDLMAWNADATRMPSRMHSEYLRKLYLDNELALGLYRVGGRVVHLENIRQPIFALGTTTDHVAPWRSVFRLIYLLDTDIEFILTNGGHNAGIVSEPGHPGRSFRRLVHRQGEPHPDPDEWLASSVPTPGSWWPAWADWLAAHSGALAEPTAPAYRAHGAAPGHYVHAA